MLQTTTLTVASGTDTTNTCDTGINQVVAFIFPATMTSTSATIKGSIDGTNFFNIINTSGVAQTVSTSTGYQYLIPDLSYALPRFIQLALGSNEGADRTIQVVTREVF